MGIQLRADSIFIQSEATPFGAVTVLVERADDIWRSVAGKADGGRRAGTRAAGPSWFVCLTVRWVYLLHMCPLASHFFSFSFNFISNSVTFTNLAR